MELIMENSIINQEIFDKLCDIYFEEVDRLSEMEYVSAPSGEYNEYNHDIIVQENRVQLIEEMFSILGIGIIDEEDEEI